MFFVLDKYHQILLKENMKAAPDKSHFFLTCVKFLAHINEGNTITPLKSRIDAIIKPRPPSNKTKTQDFLGMLNFLSKNFYQMQLSRQSRQTNLCYVRHLKFWNRPSIITITE